MRKMKSKREKEEREREPDEEDEEQERERGEIEDWKGNLIAASPSIAGNSTVIAVEALGLRGALFPSQVLKLRKVRIERDSKICIDAINSALKEEKPISTPWETIMVCLDGVDLGSWIWI
uniref:Uncharacterized protein n=1 Tax=Fagus sylvatica TaxID=28930 RepID=A0A2N9ENC4_FAGSY